MLLRDASSRFAPALSCLLIAAACSTYSAEVPLEGSGGATGAAGKPNDAGANGGTDGGPGPIEVGGENDGGCGGVGCGEEPSAEAFCSDGRRDPNEVCDDGNVESGDGCTATCAQIEGDYVCPTPGRPCVSVVKCGDKSLSLGETCDDGQLTPKSGDGCDADCQVEPGWVCPAPGLPCGAAACGDGLLAGNEQCEDGNATPKSGDGCSDTCQVEDGFVCDELGEKCRPTVCNDGKREGSEPCDDGNLIVDDECTPLCQVVPQCEKTGGACSSRCGDGLILPNDDEECDDGNSVDGDGCSAKCTVEKGYECKLVKGELPDTLTLPFVFRDFVSLPAQGKAVPRHPDFNGGCRNLLKEGIVNAVLDAQGKPTNSGLCDLPVACTLNQQFVDTGDFCYRREACDGKEPTGCLGLTHANHPITGHPGDPFSFWYRDTPGVNHTHVEAVTLRKNSDDVYSYNNPAGGLYPVDGFGWNESGDEATFNDHNYGFTTEVRYWFQFKGGERLAFAGDDDVWVFVNGHLALDLGGKHGRADRTVVLTANGDAVCDNCTTDEHPMTGTTYPLGITPGNVYEIALFHAERQTAASNFNLSLTGFVSQKSECKPVCGDRIVVADEECDDGKDNGPARHNGCTTECKRGPYCGDGHTDPPFEDCDDSVNLSQYGGCAPGCKTGPSCGDGIVQSQFEQCDDGKQLGEYGGCAPGCVLGPRCGDGKLQAAAGETCDDGNRKNLDGCSANCRDEDVK